MPVHIAFINRSSVWNDTVAEAAMKALQIQVTRDFAPAWEMDCTLHFYGADDSNPPPSFWWLTMLDNTDDATALGYHEMTSSGLPVGKAFLKTSIVDGGIPSVVASHELLEMLADPWISDLVMDNHHARPARLYAKEVCDAVEADDFAYDIGGVMVSDFVLPTWFQAWRDPGPSPGVRFDYQDQVTEPFELIAGGYISYMNMSGGGWQQGTADLVHRAQYRSQAGARRERRYLGKNFWRRSTAHT